MVMHTRSEDRFLTERTQDIRRRAQRNTFSLDEWSDEDILRGQLEDGYREGQPVPTGEDVDRTYEYDRPLETEGSERNDTDIRTLDGK